MKYFLLAAIFVITERPMAMGQSSKVLFDVLIEKCIKPLGDEIQLTGEGMEALPEATAKFMHSKSTGKAWQIREAGVALVELLASEFRGCMVDYSSRAAGNQSIDGNDLISRFRDWVDGEIKDERLIEKLLCHETEGAYFHVVELTETRIHPIRVVVSHRPDIPYTFAFAGKTTVGAEIGPCPNP